MFKVRLSPSRKNYVICLIESSLKMMKNAFHFILRAPFVLKIFKFLSQLFHHVEKTVWVERFTPKFMTSQSGLQTIAINMLSNILQSKGNQRMKFDQLIEYKKRNISLQKLCKKWGKETSSGPLFIFKKCLKWDGSKWSAA